MRAISEIGATTLVWLQPTGLEQLPAYELRAGPDLVASLRFASDTLLAAPADGETANGRWTFAREQRLRPQVVVSRSDSGEEIGRFTYGFLSDAGVLSLAKGPSYRWNRLRPTDDSSWQFTSEEGARLFSHGAEVEDGEWRIGATVTLTEAGANSPHISLLLLLGWHLRVLAYELTQRDTYA